MKTYLNKIHYHEEIKPQDWLFLSILLLCSGFYGIIVQIREFLYKFKLLKSTKLNAYVISVGNLTTGGTGKTPVTCEIANYISQNLNKRIAIISRGYGGQLSNKNTNIISNGEKIFYNSILAGDEPYWMAENCKNTAVITGKNRVKSGQYAINNFKSEFLLLDDGFQHLKLKRDLDIVLIDCIKVSGNGFLLPAGPLRELENRIKRADKVIIVNKKPFDKASEKQCEVVAKKIQEKYGKKSVVCKLNPDKIYDLKTKELFYPLKAIAFAGIGQPEFFFNSLKCQNIQLLSEMIFEDHYLYTKLVVENLIEKAQEKGADSIITTEKDAVKLMPFLNEIDTKIKICALKLRVELDLEELLKEIPC
ncbi:MAG TPA: tetraacyldisaccharide 4'-kinase [Cyanobacteria bacterium UBA9971]|nr:tetraacyldisaccharide 4'-kinase [Cyanobacteria bacterium UBA9971]